MVVGSTVGRSVPLKCDGDPLFLYTRQSGLDGLCAQGHPTAHGSLLNEDLHWLIFSCDTMGNDYLYVGMTICVLGSMLKFWDPHDCKH